MDESLFKRLKKNDLIPDDHDGSYALMRKAVWAYANLSNTAGWYEINYKDLNLLLHLVIGTWKQNIDIKKKSVEESSLDGSDKKALIREIDSVWTSACAGKYSNMEKGKPSVGMFGTGIYSFETKTDDESVKKFLDAILKIYFELKYEDVKDISQNEKYYAMLEPVFSKEFKGLGAASASQILHCFKPYIFPILNSASKEFYNGWGLKDVTKLSNYIENCRKINKILRDHGINSINYRALDLEAIKIKSDNQIAFEVWLNRQDIDKSQISEYVSSVSSVTDYISEDLNFGKNLYELDGHEALESIASIREILSETAQEEGNAFIIKSINLYEGFVLYLENIKSSKYGDRFKALLEWFVNQIRINNDVVEGRHTSGKGMDGQKLQDEYKDFRDYGSFTLDCSIQGGFNKANKTNYIHLTGTGINVCPVFDKSSTKSDVAGLQIEIKPGNNLERAYAHYNCTQLALFDNLSANDNLKRLFALYVNEIENCTGKPIDINVENDGNKKMQNSQSKNIILYGPPGTGKTYNTVMRAVEIIDGKDKWKEKDYCEIKARYDELLRENRIAFVTFHQSYGYEEFIEGIKPQTTDDGVTYEVQAGAFKEFCDRARVPIIDNGNLGINTTPTIWKVSLEGTYDNPTRKECLQNNHIRVGFDSYGKDVTSDTDFSVEGGKNVLNAFIGGMRIGDIVLSCYTNTTIDAIGVITGDYEWHDEFDKFKRVRNVRWIFKGKKDITDINGGKSFTLSTVYRLNDMSLSDVLNIVNGNDNLVKNAVATSNNTEKNKYVFIIDEINRGNISKIFGELITLIEENKREGAKEATSAKLPYSKTNFSVPDNVYIIGTMNTADRSIAAIDTALRRRFKFEEMMPKSDVIKCKNIDGIGIPQMLDRINERIEVLYDREHAIGHAYFMSLGENATIAELADIFRNKIIPLLQEYFYEDYGKICLVLGDNQKKEEYRFIKSEDIAYDKLFGSASDIGFGEKNKKFSINDAAFLKKEAYIGIYAPTNE